MDIAVIGAGPAGCNAAYRIARLGHKVTIYEEHKKIGQPVQCAGIISGSGRVPNRCIVNKIYGVRIHAPGTSPLMVNFKKPQIIIDRARFDRYLADQAVSAGVSIRNGMRLKGLSHENGKIVCRFGKENIMADKVVGADGPLSAVADSIGIPRLRCWNGIQAVYRMDNDNIIDFFPFVGTLAWIVPESSSRVRVGVMALGNAREAFEEFTSTVMGRRKKVSVQGGLIPIYDPARPSQSGDVYLVGDAAGQVKATTGGGILPGISAGNVLARCLDQGKNYHAAWKGSIGRGLYAHLLMRTALDRFDEDEYRSLIGRFRARRLRDALGSIDREQPISLAARLAFADPTLVRYVRFLV